MKYLLDPYRRQKPNEKSTRELGIGLAMGKIFVELHKGQIWAESILGQETTVSFTLPIRQPAGVAGSLETPGVPEGQRSSGNSPTV